MLPLRPRRQDANTLIWEYLDGDISPSRCQALSRMLKRKPKVRERFVESAVLHGMLFQYFRSEESSDDIAGLMVDEQQDVQPKKRKRGRWPAA